MEPKLPFILLVTSLVFLLNACGGSNEPAATEQNATALTSVEEEALILKLSMLMSADTSRAGRDNNLLVNYAIDHLHQVETTQSGLIYEIIQQGTGETIEWGDFLSAHYKGSFLDGTTFDSSYKRGKPLEFYVGNMIDGWNEGLELIQVGGKIRLLVPSHLAYGKAGLVASNNKVIVPPHELLLFEVEVLAKEEIVD